MALLLVLDTSTLNASVAVVEGDLAPEAPPLRVLGRAGRIVTTHSETLLELVDEALRQAGVEGPRLQAIGCGAGPGSFTGLRIGLCTAKGLSYAWNKPLVMASSLRAMALEAVVTKVSPDVSSEIVVAIVVEAKKGEIYAGFYTGGTARPLGAEVALPPHAFAAHARKLAPDGPWVVCGPGVMPYEAAMQGLGAASLVAKPLGPDAAYLGRLCLERLATHGPEDVARAVPFYARPSEAEAKLQALGNRER